MVCFNWLVWIFVYGVRVLMIDYLLGYLVIGILGILK